MIFYQHGIAGYPRGLAQKLRHVGGMVQNVHQQANLEGAIRKGQMTSVEGPACDTAAGPGRDFDALDRQIRPLFLEKCSDRAVTTADIKHAGSFAHKRCNYAGQNASAATKHQRVVASRDPGKRPRLGRGSQNLLRGNL